MSDFLVIMDIPSIKKYVFSTFKLKEIQGASIIIDQLNRLGFETKLKEYIQADKIEKIYANGGSALFIVRNLEESALQNALVMIGGFVRQATKGISTLNWGVTELESDFQAANRKARINLNRHSEKADSPISSTHIPFSKECESCSSQPTITLTHDGDWLCAACSIKRDNRDKKTGIWQEFNDFLRRAGSGINENPIERSKNFTEIGQACYNNYLAIVYADGNAIGKFIREIDTEARFRDFAEIIDNSIKQACFGALAEVFHQDLSGNDGKKIPADLLLLGGDDLLVALPADKALYFAYTVSRAFELLTKTKFLQSEDTFFKDRLSGKGCTISLGVAVGKANHPFRVLLAQAEALLQEAKKAGSQDPERYAFWMPSYVDFHLSSQSHQLSISNIRTIDYMFKAQTSAGMEESFSRTFRPYRLDQLKQLFEAVDELKAISFPKTKLNALYRGILQNRSQAMLDTIRILSHCNDREKEKFHMILERFGCRQSLPWSEGNRTFLTELIEFYDLLDASPVNDIQ